MKFTIDMEMPDLEKNVISFKCPACKKTTKVKIEDIQKRKFNKCPKCKIPIKWK